MGRVGWAKPHNFFAPSRRCAAASGNILESRRRICDGVNNTHGLLEWVVAAHAT